MSNTQSISLPESESMPPWFLDKSFLTNAAAVGVIAIGHVSPMFQDTFKNVGYFALSGAITNWLAIHMLFEKVPGCYGSGVIPNRFEDFKGGISRLIMNQFFTVENIQRFMSDRTKDGIDLGRVADALDFEPLFVKLTEAIRESSFGPMLAMFGGEKALEPLKPKFEKKLREALSELGQDPKVQDAINQGIGMNLSGPGIRAHVESIVKARLDELTPQMVKIIVQDMIKKHLGWLVVWGGVFGGLIGLLPSFF